MDFRCYRNGVAQEWLQNRIMELRHMAAPLKRLFNMVEVTLAIAVVGIGISGIMALFPVAINSTRDAVGDSYASFAADKFIHFFAGSATADSDVPSDPDKFWNMYIKTLLSTSPANASAINSAATGSWVATNAPGVYRTSTLSQLFKIAQGDPARPDFDGTVNIWISETATSVYNGSEWKLWPKDGGGIDYKDYLVGLNLEISWPNSKLYANREKRYFYLEVAKPKK